MTFAEEHQLETYKSLVTISLAGLQAALLINGGAIVALLTFIGQSDLGPVMAHELGRPIIYFGGGVFLSALAFLFSYSTQLALYNEHFPQGRYWPKDHRPFLWLGIGSFLCSVALFGFGSTFSLDAFVENTEQQRQTQIQSFVLYRNSIADANERIPVATFGVEQRDVYNHENCDQARKLFQSQPGTTAKFWCEAGLKE